MITLFGSAGGTVACHGSPDVCELPVEDLSPVEPEEDVPPVVEPQDATVADMAKTTTSVTAELRLSQGIQCRPNRSER
jgi:hypothetical protein